MNVYSDNSVIELDKNTVVTIGTFDGLHLGHRDIIRHLNKEADKRNARNFVITFEPHPRKVLGYDNGIKLLTSLEEKKRFFELNGVENLLVVNFTKEFSQLSSAEFVEKWICNKIGVSHIVIGYDHKFGKGRDGDENLLREMGKEKGFTVSTVPPVKFDDITISSTKIRKLIADGEIKFANKLLGHNYTLRGTVVEGAKRGRTIGFPTANIGNVFEDKLIPKKGVYAVKINIGGISYGGVMNIGCRPTFNDTEELMLEVFIFDFDENIYNINVELEFLEYLREEKKFDSKEALVEQLKKDAEIANEIIYNN